MKKPKRREKKLKLVAPTDEDRRSIAVTVAWMLGTLVTILANSVALITDFLNLTLVPGVMLFSASVTGVVSLVLLPLVYRFRATPPPYSIVIVSVIAAFLPWLVLIAMGFA